MTKVNSIGVVDSKGTVDAPAPPANLEHPVFDGAHWFSDKDRWTEGYYLSCATPVVPESVTPRQIRQALTKVGLRAQVEAAVAAGDQDIKDWWEFSLTVERNNPQVQAMATALGLSSAQVDDLWIMADTL